MYPLKGGFVETGEDVVEMHHLLREIRRTLVRYAFKRKLKIGMLGWTNRNVSSDE